MSKLAWNRPQDQTFEAGLDRGVIYIEGGEAVAWTGLSSVEDSGEATLREFYIDGIKYLSMVSPRDWKGTLNAYTFPDEFGELIGIAELGDGLYIDGQQPGRFGLSYRTMVTTPAIDKKQHYKIHLIYKVVASLGEFSYETLSSEATDPTGFEFELAAVPIRIPGFRPSAHIILDTRKIDEQSLKTLEDLLYGTDTQEPAMPSIEELVDLLKYSGPVTVVYNGDGTWTATGSNRNIRMLDGKGHFQIDNVAAEYLSEDIYRFLGLEEAARQVLVEDADGVPYFKLGEGISNIGIDTDGVPYFNVGSSQGTLALDTDDVPYYDFN